jgi:hypothetical protein
MVRLNWVEKCGRTLSQPDNYRNGEWLIISIRPLRPARLFAVVATALLRKTDLARQ